ncbi:MAG: FAD-dependent oxidoreductase [Syntrophomonadaceae bacterium]
MHLYEGSLYWDKTVDYPLEFPPVREKLQTEILIAGGGITGNLCAFVLSAAGWEVTVVDERRLGMGSTLANTGLLQYRSDKMLCEFVDDIGEERAYLFYRMCLEAMEQLSVLNDKLTGPTDYVLKDSIYYASTEQDRQKLLREYKYLTKYGFPVEFLDQEDLSKRYGIAKACALRTWQDAEMNPYLFTQALIRKNWEQGVRYFENTGLDLENVQSHRVLTRAGYAIDFEHLVLATGYTLGYPAIRARTLVRRTYAFCSAPIRQPLWPEQVMIWETKTPYLYMRAAGDDRIIAGGLDEDTDYLEKDAYKIRARAEALARQVESLFPYLDIEIAYAWNAIFCGSTDGLPLIGPDPDHPNRFYVLGYEGNGVCYSMAGAHLLKDHISGKSNPYQDIVKVSRP